MQGCGADSPDITVAINKGDNPERVVIPAGAYEDLVNDAAFDGGEVTLDPRSFLILRAAQ